MHSMLFLVLCMAIVTLLASQDARQVIKDYNLIPSDVRNVMFVGKSNSGKTTTVEVLKNPLYVAPYETFTRGTIKPEYFSFTIHAEGKYYNINIMDTPGLFERGTDANETRDSDTIMDLINKCVDLELTKIHRIYFVMYAAAGLNPQDEESLRLFAELFKGAESKIRVIFTRSQRSDEEFKEHMIKQLTQFDIFRGYKDKIYFAGAIPKSEAKSVGTDVIENIHEMRVKILDDLFSEQEAFNVKNMSMYRRRISLVRRVYEALKDGTSVSAELLYEFGRIWEFWDELWAPAGTAAPTVADKEL